MQGAIRTYLVLARNKIVPSLAIDHGVRLRLLPSIALVTAGMTPVAPVPAVAEAVPVVVSW